MGGNKMEEFTDQLIKDSIAATEKAIALAREQANRADNSEKLLKNSLDNFSKILEVLESVVAENETLKKRVAELQAIVDDYYLQW